MLLRGKLVPKSILCFFIIFLMSGCTAIKLIKESSLQKPDFKYVDHSIGTPSSKKVDALLNFTAYNPNDIGLKNVYLSYDLYVEDKPFLKGSDIELNLTPNGETKIQVPAEIVYKKAFKALGPLAERVLLRQKTFPVVAKVKIYGLPTVYNQYEEGGLFSFEVEVSHTMDVPIPYDEIDKAADKAKKALKKLF